MNKDITTTVLAAITSPQTYGQSITLTATVAVTSAGVGTPTGTVTYYDGTTPIGAATLNGATPDRASFTTSTLGVGDHAITARYAGASTSQPSTTSPSTPLLIQASTTTLYNGLQILNIGSTLSVGARVTSSPPVATCTNNTSTATPAPAPYVTFALDSNPLIGAAGSYPVASNVPLKSGTAARAGISTTNWIEGAYTLTATYTGPAGCSTSCDTATLTVASPGAAANGGGWYTLPGSGRINFGFVVHKIAGTTPAQYKGQHTLMNNGKWRLKASLLTYSKTSTGQAAASGTGTLFWWNQSLNGGLRRLATRRLDPVSFTISFTATGSNTKTTPGSFGIHINYTSTPPEPSTLPNSSPRPLNGGRTKAS